MAKSDVESLSARFALLNCSVTKKASKFMATVTDDVLLEILVRLPDARAAIQSSVVCKRWHSLLTDPHFRKRFLQHRNNHKQILEFSILFKYTFNNEAQFYELEWDYKSQPYDLSFMPDPATVGLVAAFGDLLLLARGIRHYYICNSLTNQWFALPEIPPVSFFSGRFKKFFFAGSYGYALVCDPRNGRRFKALMIHQSQFSNSKYIFELAIFDVETGVWTHPHFSVPYPMLESSRGFILPLEIVFAGNGILYWLDGVDEFFFVAAFDPFDSQVRLIGLPADLSFNGVDRMRPKDRVRLAVVGGRLRLSRMIKIDEKCFRWRVWELDSDNDTWLLVHDFALNAPGTAIDPMFFVLSFDPIDSNVVFLVCDKEIFRYDIDQETYERVGQFPCLGESIDQVKENVGAYLKVLTNVQPLWPTPIPLLEYHQSYEEKSSMSFN